jgi:hypothetical protein
MVLNPQKTEIQFPNGNIAQAIKVIRKTSPKSILKVLDLNPFPTAVIPISGGAKYLSPIGFTRIYSFVEAVVDLAFEKNIMLVDGGTNTGVMEIIGKHYGFVQAQNPKKIIPPLIGFIPLPLVKLPGQEFTNEDVLLQPHHPYFIFVHDAYEWGEEVESMFALVIW